MKLASLRFRFVRLLALLPLCLASTLALPWGSEGHKTVGDIANELLTPQARQQVSDLLVDDLDASGAPSGRKTLGEVASWPDEIRSTPKGKGVAPWHFDDVPLCTPAPKSEWCPDGNCASEQIARHYATLQNPAASHLERNEALKWIVHLVGDIHQPLHSANHDDRGGNDVSVTFLDNAAPKLNLHSVWDTYAVRRLLEEKSLTGASMAQSITAQQQADWSNGTVSQWVAEATDLARNVTYKQLPGGFACDAKIEDRLDLDETYYAQAAPVIELQLKKAGFRLAGILNAAFLAPTPADTHGADTTGISVAPAAPSSGGPLPLLSQGHPVDWWFVFKLNAKAFPGCGAGAERACPFGGEVRGGADGASYTFGQQYVYASSESKKLQQGPGCVGDTGTDPVGATFDQVYNGSAYYVIWNDQFYGDPKISCENSSGNCPSPWGHSKGMLAWNDAGDGYVLQVSTPSWPAAGSKANPRQSDGNTLGCVNDDNVKVSQHFFALRLSKDDVVKMLKALQNASVATDPDDRQIVNPGGPPEIRALVATLGRKSISRTATVDVLSTGVKLISKPSALNVPPWQMVSSLLNGVGLRAATWWASPQIPSTSASTQIACWDDALPAPGPVDIAISGTWGGQTFGLKGGPGPDFNHAKIGVSTTPGSHYAIFGDLNQQGTVDGDNCKSSQNGRGGTFFVVDDEALASELGALIQGDTAPGK